jgi:hypothetical protein
MIAGIFHQGSGLGNQLFRYITTRVLALDKGYRFGMLNDKDFKGNELFKLEMGERPLFSKHWPMEMYSFEEKKVVENGVDIRGYDPEINFVEDNTVIEGEFQDERYWGHRLDEIREWLKVEPLEMPDDVCVINFRGGEYSVYPDLFLTKEYWDEAIQLMRDKFQPIVADVVQELKFEVHTDDPVLARQFFPDFKIVDNAMITDDKRYSQIALNWRSIRYAKYLIIANTSFAILPALLSENVKTVIAPRYWARRNTGTWALPQNYYKKFIYI